MKKRGSTIINTGLRNWQEEQKEESINKIIQAIKSRQEVGVQDISITMLMEDTGFSRPLFSKEHIIPILQQYNIGRYRVYLKLPSEDKDKITYLKEELFKAKNQIMRLENLLETQENQNAKLKLENNKLKKEQEYLSYDIYELKRKLSIYTSK
jgi:hypothetical protein